MDMAAELESKLFGFAMFCACFVWVSVLLGLAELYRWRMKRRGHGQPGGGVWIYLPEWPGYGEEDQG